VNKRICNISKMYLGHTLLTSVRHLQPPKSVCVVISTCTGPIASIVSNQTVCNTTYIRANGSSESISFQPSQWRMQAGLTCDASASRDLSHEALLPIVATDERHAPFLEQVAAALTRRVQDCDTHALNRAPDADVLAAFAAATPPAISLQAYVLRLARYTGCATSCFLYAVAYIQTVEDQVPVSALTAHRCACMRVMTLLCGSPCATVRLFVCPPAR
jgi:hypothetical protein